MTAWHVPREVLARFATDPADLDDVTASSVESHLTRCAPCRAGVAAGADPVFRDRSWQGVLEAVDRPRRGVVEHLLALLLRGETARLIAATPALQLSSLGAVAAVIAVAVAVSRTTGSPVPFLVLAPLVPLAGVAAAFWPGADPGGEAAAAAPLADAGLLLRRARAVVAASVLVLAAGALALPQLGPGAVAWLLPALLLTTTALAASTWVDPQRAVGAMGAAWIVTVLVVAHTGPAATSIADSFLFTAPGQRAFAALTVLAATAATARRRHFSYLEVR